jgi:tyrosyl-tRNA synthetase
MFSEAPVFTVPEDARRDKIPLLEILSLTDLFPSKSEARRTILNGGLSVNGSRYGSLILFMLKPRSSDPESFIYDHERVGGTFIVLRRGKKQFALVKWP